LSRKCLATVVNTSLGGGRMVWELELVVNQRGWLRTIVSETQRGVALDRRVGVMALHPTGRPVQNAFIESFNSKLRDECLNEHFFSGPQRRAT
jgi:putative transposase